MKNKTYRFAVALAVLLTFCLVFMMPAAADSTYNGEIVLPNEVSFTGTDTVYDGTNYYANLATAVKGIHNSENAILYCKPGADVGAMTHGHVCESLTVYGNGAYTSGNGDFEIGFPTATGTDCPGPISDLTLKVYNLTGAGAWGSVSGTYTVNLVFEDCKNMVQVFFMGNSFTLNIDLTDCTFTSNDISICKVYSNAKGTISIKDCEFSNVDQPVALNNKGDGQQTITIEDCTFTSCGAETYDYTVPVSVSSSAEGASSVLTVSNCEFTDTKTNSIGQNVDVLLNYGKGITTASVSETTAKVIVETQNNVGETQEITSTETLETSNAVASVGNDKYTDIQEAIKAAAPSGTVDILGDITVDKWIMFSERLSIGNGNIITLVIDGLTINGNGHTLTINSIESAGNGNRLFYDATNLNINNLIINYADGVAGGIGLQSGTISGVTIEGGCGIFPGTGNIVINGCTFETSGHVIYYEEARDNLEVTGCTFEVPETANVILLRGNEKFTDNTIVSGRTVNVVSGSPTVTGNDFGDVRLKVYTAATAEISGNEISNLAFEDDATEVNSAFGDNTLSDAAQEALNKVDYVVLPSTQPATPSSSSGGHSEPGAYYNYPRTVSDGGLVEFGTSKVVKSVTLPAGSNGAVVLHIDSTAYWPLATDSEFTFDISVENLGVGTSYISFKIDESKLSALDITAADVGVYHNVNGEWVKLTVTYKIEEGDVIYTAETDSFSPFKLVVEAGAAKPAETQDEPVTPPTEEPSDEPQDVPGEILPEIPGVQDEPEEPSSPAPLLGVLAALGAAVVLRRK